MSTAFARLLFGESGDLHPDGYTLSDHGSALISDLRGHRGALGYADYVYYSTRGEGVRLLAIDAGERCVGPFPDAFELSPDELVIGPLYVYVNKSSLARPEVRAFVEYYMEEAPWSAPKTRYARLAPEQYRKNLALLMGCTTAEMRSRDGNILEDLDLPDCWEPAPSSATSDRAALVALYNATDGPNWKNNANWASDRPLGRWYGVTTDGNGRVTRLDLHDNRLTGRIPAQIANLSNLGHLSLSFNQLTGPMPPQLTNLASLRWLDLSQNQLTGSIPPQLADLASLELLWLSDNQLTGPVLPQLANLANLHMLSLHSNQLTGPIPPQLGNLASLRYLYLAGNQLTGSIPPQLGDLTNLEDLWLNDNRLTGPIPPQLGSLANLGVLSLHSNQLTGAIPPQLGNVANLGQLLLSSNLLTGELPSGLTDRAALISFHFLGNAGLCAPAEYALQAWLQGLEHVRGDVCPASTLSMPSVTSDRTILVVLYNATGGPNWKNNTNWLSDRPLSEWYGVLTDGDSRVTGLQHHNNQLTGSIPPVLGNLANVDRLGLNDNELTGPIPPHLGNLASLQELWLNNNQLTGPIPSQLGNLTNLESLWVSGNQLTGPIPPRLGNLANLDSLRLHDNQLTRPIPSELGNLTNLRELSLYSNLLTGPVPPQLGNLANLVYLYLSDNQLTGPIPSQLANLGYLGLSGNQLTGPIPPRLGNLANLEGLQLHDNQLTGPIPFQLGNLANLHRLYLNNNQLTGELPSSLTDLAALISFHFQGNVGLCAPPDSAFHAWLQDIDDLAGDTCATTPAAGTPVPTPDRAALVALYDAAGGPNWKNNTNWLSDRPLSEWYGVITGGHSRVTRLNLEHNGLTGLIPPELGSLSQLHYLTFRGNDLEPIQQPRWRGK